MAQDKNYPIINQQSFYNGLSFDETIGADSSLSYIKGFDWRKNPSELVQAMQPRQIDSGNLDDLIVNIIQVSATGERFGLGTKGNFYLIDTTNAVQKIENIGENGAFGLTYHEPTDTIYITGVTSIHKFGAVKDTANRKLTRNYLTTSVSTYNTGSSPAFRNGGGSSYTVPNTPTPDESSTNARLDFLSDIEPLSGIRIKIGSPSSGDWTIKIHDPLHREIATSTIPAADIKPNDFNLFTFAPTELLVKPNAMTYHVHISCTTSGGTVITGTDGNFNTADFSIQADRLVSSGNGIHCMIQFLQYIIIGNGRYFSLWEPLTDAPDNTEYQRHALTLPSGYQSCGVTTTDEFVMMAFEKKSVIPSRKSNEGLLVMYDGLSGTYSQYIELKEGAPQALYTKDNIPHMIISGTLYVYLGGKSITRIRDLPNTDNDFTGVKDDTVSYPYAMASFKKLLHMAYPSESSNQALEYGLYNYGSVAAEYKPSFGYQYGLSHEILSNTSTISLKTGCVAAFGDEMYISWQKTVDGVTSYGLDIVDSKCKVARSFKARSRRFDGRNIHKKKGALQVFINTNPIPSGTKVYPFYKLDDEPEVVRKDPMKEGQVEAVFNIAGKEFRKIDYGVVGTSEATVGTPLRVRGIAIEWDPKQEEGTVNGEQ